MTPNEIVLWSAELGSLGLIVLLAVADLAYTRSKAALRSLGFLAASWIFLLLMSGLLPLLIPALPAPWLFALQVMIGPLCSSLGSYMGGIWLSARKRDRLMEAGFRSATLVCLVGAPACLLLPLAWQLPAAAALSFCNLSLALWLSVRAAQLGDRMAWGLALACVLTLPFQMGMYLLIDAARPSLGVQLGIALCGLLGFVVFGVMLYTRNRHLLRAKRDVSSEIDPITQLFGSMAMVQKILAAQRRQAVTGSNGALIAVLVFEPEKLAAQVGQYGLNEIYAELARRTQRQLGVLNPVGRYYDRCFIGLIETLHSPRLMRTMGLRVAARLRRPIEVSTPSGKRITLRAEIGVGLVHFSRANKDVDQLLHDAQQMAGQARGMRSRAAIIDSVNARAQPVEKAVLDGPWSGLKPASSVAPHSTALGNF
ncbi:MAG: hypothetical protein ACKVOO_00175 [Burkholderiaceae bacterium]